MPSSQAERRRVLLENLTLTDRTYCGYLQATQYPPGSRPIAEQPDQVYPNAPVTDLHAMREEGGASNAKVRIQTSQSRVHLAAGESVALSLRALDEQDQVLPLVVTRAVAQGLVFDGRRAATISPTA